MYSTILVIRSPNIVSATMKGPYSRIRIGDLCTWDFACSVLQYTINPSRIRIGDLVARGIFYQLFQTPVLHRTPQTAAVTASVMLLATPRKRATHRPLSSSFLGLPYRIPNINHKRELLRGLWLEKQLCECRIAAMSLHPFKGFVLWSKRGFPKIRGTLFWGP